MKLKPIAAAASILGIVSSSMLSANPAREAWIDLVVERNRDRPEFAFVENDPSLPNVLIYGDSISMGYTPHVREKLEGEANVYRIHRNGGDVGRVIRVMKEMEAAMGDHWSFEWDVIFFNAGLHDLKYLDADGNYAIRAGKQVRSPQGYAQRLRRSLNYLKSENPGAQVIFATTTPVPEGAKGRKAGDAVRFNEAALDVLENEYPEIIVHDLYSLTKPNMNQWQVRPGNVHYNAVGRAAQGDSVAEAISAALASLSLAAAPQIIIKADDVGNCGPKIEPAWQRFVDYIEAEDIQASIGLVTDSLENGSEAYYDWIRDLHDSGRIEFWHHGYDHSRERGVSKPTWWEFRNTDYDHQKLHFERGMELAEEKLGITFRTFGSPYNANDATTVQVLEENSDLRIWLYPPDIPSSKRPLKRIGALNIEKPVGVISFEPFASNYADYVDEPVLVLQCHPGNWDEASWSEFKKIVGFLKAEGASFTTPKGYFDIEKT